MQCRASALPLVLGLLLAGPAPVLAQPASSGEPKQAPKPVAAGAERAEAKPVALSTITYDVGDLVAYRNRVSGVGFPGGPYKPDDLVKSIVDANPEIWSKPEGGHAIREVSGTKLEIRTSAKQHAEISELLDALRRLADVTVIVGATLYEVDRAFYEKELKSKRTPDQPRLIDPDLAQLIDRKGTRVTPANVEIIPNGEEVPISSLRKVLVYRGKPGDPRKKPREVFATTRYGVSVRSSVMVSADRRSIRMKIAQQVTDLEEVEKKTIPDLEGGGESVVDVPRFVESSTAATIEVEDNGYILVPVHSRSLVAGGKDRALVLLVQPEIYIEAEKKAMREQAARERWQKALRWLRAMAFPALELYEEFSGNSVTSR
jgi:hypothetical protein